MTTIPLNKLTIWAENVRKTGAGDAIDELAASIAAHGLLQSLVVRKSARGKFAVVAGGRRLLALTALAERGQVAPDLGVECHVIEADTDATEIGLAENVVRRAMHPADQFEAFAALITKGASVADVAARFGVSEGIVTARMKLGRVSPTLLDAYRAGEMNLEQVQAFAVSDSHADQERVWDGLPDHSRGPWSIRQALTEGEIPATDKRVRCIGLEAYEAAGGAVRRDLFDDRNAGYVLDAGLLDRLVQQSFDAAAEEVRAEGWGWVEARAVFGYDDRAGFHRVFPAVAEFTDAEEAELEALQAERDDLEDACPEDEEADPEVTARLEEIDARIEALTDRPGHWEPEVMANAGAVVSLSGDGTVVVERGLMRREDAPDQDNASDEETAARIATLPATLIASLTAQKTAALRATLAQQPDVALAAVTHALARSAFYTYGGETCLTLTAEQRSLTKASGQPEDCAGLFAFDAERGRWGDRLPGNADDLFAWCLSQTQDTLLDLLAVSAAHMVDAVRDKGTREDAPRLQHADALGKALGLKMADWFTPTAANYFGRVNRSFILEAMAEAGIPARTRSWAKLKKGELAALAERELSGTGWLPHPLRDLAGAVEPDGAQEGMPAAAAA
jgi:ParB family chromosome partitioning protein